MLDQMIQRIIRIIKLDTTVYGEIEHDENANTEAAIIVVVTSLLAAIGTGVAAGGGFIGPFIGRFILGILVNWLLWSFLTMFIGTRLFQGQATFWEMARLLGYANAPQVLGIFAIISCLGLIAGLVGSVLSLIAAFFAIREGLDLTTEKSILTILIGWIVIVVVNVLLVAVF